MSYYVCICEVQTPYDSRVAVASQSGTSSSSGLRDGTERFSDLLQSGSLSPVIVGKASGSSTYPRQTLRLPHAPAQWIIDNV